MDARISNNRVAFTHWFETDDDGGSIDFDVLICRVDEDEFWIDDECDSERITIDQIKTIYGDDVALLASALRF